MAKSDTLALTLVAKLAASALRSLVPVTAIEVPSMEAASDPLVTPIVITWALIPVPRVIFVSSSTTFLIGPELAAM